MKLSFKRRIEFIHRYLSEHPGHPIEIDELCNQAVKALALQKPLSVTQMRYSIQELRRTLLEPASLQIVGKNHVVLKAKRLPGEQRDQIHSEDKLKIAHAFWHFLFGKESPGKETIKYAYPAGGIANWGDPGQINFGGADFSERLVTLRRRAGVNVMIDSGSSTRAVAGSLISAESMPFAVGSPPLMEFKNWTSMQNSRRYILPTVITNSPRVIVDVLQSNHVDKFELRMIGGVVRGKYGSVAGELAQTCIECWGHSGKMIRFDVAVVGTTGVRRTFAGGAAFGVEHLEEATLKARLLSEAQIRCVVMDSSKLINEEVSCVFAPVSGQSVDVVFLDQGNATTDARVLEFANQAIERHVLPVIVLNKDSERFINLTANLGSSVNDQTISPSKPVEQKSKQRRGGGVPDWTIWSTKKL